LTAISPIKPRIGRIGHGASSGSSAQVSLDDDPVNEGY
jgi:hypothetical protein